MIYIMVFMPGICPVDDPHQLVVYFCVNDSRNSHEEGKKADVRSVKRDVEREIKYRIVT